MYSMQRNNGFCANPFNDMNKLMKQQHEHQQATFKPYKLESPASKHSNLSSGPTTPNALPSNTINDVYDLNSSPNIDSSLMPSKSNANQMQTDDMLALSPRLKQEVQVNSRISAMINQQQQQSRNMSPASVDVYNFVDDEIHSMTSHIGHVESNFGMLQQEIGRMGHGYSSANAMRGNGNQSSAMNNHSLMETQAPIANDAAPKKRGRKKKIRDEKQ